VATLPFAVVTGAMSPAAIALMKRAGTKLVVTAGLAMMSAGFVVAAGTGVSAPYWGRIVISMTLMAAGLALTSSPATEAIMGALPPGKAGAGSAVNDTTRELGGTLGVAIVGSALSSVYGSHVVAALTRLGVPAGAGAAARQSVVAGLQVAGHLPPGLRSVAGAATRQAFTDGLHGGSLVAAGATAVAALATLAFLPARAGRAAPEPEPESAEAGAGQDAGARREQVPAGTGGRER
jgi:hypothetical protein